MKIPKKSAVIFIIFLVSGSASLSQSDFLLNNFGSIPQTLNANPANIPRSSFSVGLPVITSVYNGLHNNAFTTNELLRERENDDSLVVDVPHILPMLKSTNYFTQYSNIDLLFLGLKIKKGYLSIGVQNKSALRVTYPKSLAQLAWYGNNKYLGEELDMSDFRISMHHYLSFYAGYAQQISPQLSIGIRLQLLKGLSNIHTNTMNLKALTDFSQGELYTIRLINDIEVNTSSVDQLGIGSDEGFDLKKYLSYEKNSGFAINAGFNWELAYNFNLSLSVVDLGYIYWVSDVRTYKSSRSEANFNGVDVDLSEDINSLDVYIDSLNAIFQFDENQKEYLTGIPARINVGGYYDFYKNNTIGLLANWRFYNGITERAISLSYDKRFDDMFHFRLCWSAINDTYDNFGIAAVLRLGSIQAYFTTENVYTLFDPWNAHNHSFHFGIIYNLLKCRDRDELDGKKVDFMFPQYKVPGEGVPGLEQQINNYWERKSNRENIGK